MGLSLKSYLLFNINNVLLINIEVIKILLLYQNINTIILT